MFAIEINFNDALGRSESILVPRQQALVGGSDYAHVFIDDMRKLKYQLRLTRQIGRTFECKLVGSDYSSAIADLVEGSHENSADFDLGLVRMHIEALDIDLVQKESEPVERAAVRVLRQACASTSPRFPAVVVVGNNKVAQSFNASQPIFIGRSKNCALRFDSADISSKHARMGYEADSFWVEDLGSTNGTFVNKQQVSGRTQVPAGVPVVLGREISIYGVVSEDQLKLVSNSDPEPVDLSELSHYPALVSDSEVARPAKLILKPGRVFWLGRDPSCDMWLGAPYVSRHHCSVEMKEDGRVIVTDQSTNGTVHRDGLLKKGQELVLEFKGSELRFGPDIKIALVFEHNEEQEFLHGPSKRVPAMTTLGATASARSVIKRSDDRPLSLHGGVGLSKAHPGYQARLFLSKVIMGVVLTMVALLLIIGFM